MTNIKNNYEDYWKTRLTWSSGGMGNDVSPNEIFESVAFIAVKGLRLLDMGCGNGTYLSLVKSRFQEIYGCDISESALHEVQKKDIQAVCADLNKGYIPYKSDSFDTVTAMELLKHVIDPLQLLIDVKRILRSGGKLILTTPNIRYFRNLNTLLFKGVFPHTTTDHFIWGGGHFHYFTRKDVAFLLREAGFEMISFHMNRMQFVRSWKRRLIHAIVMDVFFRDFFCAGITVEAIKL